MLAFGFFNILWAFRVYQANSESIGNIGTIAAFIGNVFLLADLGSGIAVLFFGLFILTYKFFWAYKHFFKVERAFEAKIILD